MGNSDSLTKKYVRKPLVVEAVQVTEENFEEVARWCFGKIHWKDGDGLVDDHEDDWLQPNKQYILVRVQNPKHVRQTHAVVGDWILYSDRGYKVYTIKAFTASFDLVESTTPTT